MLLDDDAVEACVDLIRRTGATGFEIGYLHEDVPVEEAGWYAHARYRGARITVDDQPGPVEAADALSRRLLTGAHCQHCGRLVTLSAPIARPAQCRWRRMGNKWTRGCEGTGGDQ